MSDDPKNKWLEPPVILYFVSMAIAVGTAWVNLDRRVGDLERDDTHYIRQLDETRTDMKTLSDKIDQLLLKRD